MNDMMKSMEENFEKVRNTKAMFNEIVGQKFRKMNTGRMFPHVYIFCDT
jgi:hypothetical protein